MKKITLALSAMLLTTSSALAIRNGSYVVVPADQTAQATGKFLSVDASGKLALSNDLNDAAKWEVGSGDMDENYNLPQYLKNGEKFLSLSEDGATMSDAQVNTFVNTNWEIDYSYVISNNANFWQGEQPDPLYLNALNLGVDPEQSANSAFYFVMWEEGMTATDVENQLWTYMHPQAKVIAVGGLAARAKGKYMAVTDEGRLITTNTLNDNAVWEEDWDDEAGMPTFSNLGVKGYLYEGNTSRQITLSATPKPINLVSSEKVIGAFGITTNLEAEDGTSGDFLNALNTNSADGEQGGIGTWSLDEGSSFFMMEWDPSISAEELDDQVTQLIQVGMAKAPILTEVKKYMNASAQGRNYGDSELYDIENAETDEELQAAKAAAIQAAIGYAESTMEEGFVLKSTRTNKYITEVDNAEKPIVQTDAADQNSMWYAEEVAAPDAQEDAEYTFKTFVLRNGVTGKYVGKCAGYSQVTPLADDAASAATMTLELGTRGFIIRQTNTGVDNAYLNVSTNPGAPELTVWSDANDDGAYFTFDLLPTIPAEKAWVNFVGETTPNPYMGGVSYTKLSAIEVCLPAEETAKATGNGSITVYQLEYNPDTYEDIRTDIAVIPGSSLKDLKPEIRKAGFTYMDYMEGIMVTDSVMAATFTVQLPETVTATGSYYVEVEPYMFSAPYEGAETLTGSMQNSVEVTAPAELMPVAVEPESGKVEELTEIVIDRNSEQGWFVPTPANTEEHLTVTYNGEIAKDTGDRAIDVTGAELEERYFMYNYEAGITGGYYIPVNFTKAGTYKLTIPEGFLLDQMYNSNELTEVEWVIDEKDGIAEISTVKVNGKVIYDLSGRRVNKATRGLYIIDGVKTIVK